VTEKPKETAVPVYVQLELDLDSAYAEKEDGYTAFQQRQREQLARIAETWRLPIHRRVRIKLKWRPDEIEGVLILREHPKTLCGRTPLLLRVGGWDFESTEIDACHIVR
jgi:hypothetical protein